MYYDDHETLRFLDPGLDRILDELTKEKQEERMAAQRERLRVAKLKSQQGDNTDNEPQR
jgi:hypothetical protein